MANQLIFINYHLLETITAGSRRQKRPNPKYANTPDKTVGRSEKTKNIRVDTCDNNESPTKHPRTTTSTLNVTDDAAAATATVEPSDAAASTQLTTSPENPEISLTTASSDAVITSPASIGPSVSRSTAVNEVSIGTPSTAMSSPSTSPPPAAAGDCNNLQLSQYHRGLDSLPPQSEGAAKGLKQYDDTSSEDFLMWKLDLRDADHALKLLGMGAKLYRTAVLYEEIS